jgi:PAS domain S-box-containing protein
MSILTSIANWVRLGWDRYTSPLIPIHDPVRSRELRLLASLLLTTVILIFFILCWVIVTSETGLPIPQITSSSVTFVLTLLFLALVRRGHERFAIPILVASGNFVLLLGAAVLANRAGLGYLDYMVIISIFGGLFLSVRQIAVMLLCQLLGMLLVAPLLKEVPFVEVAGGPMLFTTTSTAILLVVAHHWRRSEREQREVLAASEAQYRLLVERNRDIIYSQGLNGKILTINSAVERMLGYTPAEVIGKNIADYIKTEDHPVVYKYLLDILHHEDAIPLEMRVQTRAQEWIWTEIRLSPIFHPNGSITMAGVVRDISPRKQAEEALYSINARYRLLTELSSDYSFETIRTPDGRIFTVWVLDSVQRMLGYSVKEILALDDMRTLYHPEDWPDAARDIRRAFAGEALRNEYRMLTKSGEARWVQVYYSPVVEADGHVERIYGIAKDMTESRYKTEQQTKLAVQRERIRLVNLVVLAVSHDFRTALSTIETSRYLIERKVDEVNRLTIQNRLDSIQKAVLHLTEQIENLHLISALTDPTPRWFDWNIMIKSEMDDFQPSTEAKMVHLIFDPQPDLPRIEADEDKLRYALAHLLKNALVHTPPEGTVRVRTLAVNGHMQVKIEDTGSGIAPEQLELIFDPFYRTDQARTQQIGGVGLGLTLVRMIAESHQGQVTVESQMGKGSVFTLSIPYSQRPSPPAESESPLGKQAT